MQPMSCCLRRSAAAAARGVRLWLAWWWLDQRPSYKGVLTASESMGACVPSNLTNGFESALGAEEECARGVLFDHDRFGWRPMPEQLHIGGVCKGFIRTRLLTPCTSRLLQRPGCGIWSGLLQGVQWMAASQHTLPQQKNTEY